jgi:probable phosphoglycerate mutase
VTTFLLIRHGTNDWIGRSLAARLPDVHLNAEGQRQAAGLVERLKGTAIARIISSPLDRALETAAPLSKDRGIEVEVSDAVTEIGFGEWSGLSMEELSGQPLWSRWNSFRSATRAPGGEIMSETQARMVSEVTRLREESPDGTIALFSHGDPLRSVVAYFLGMPLDFYSRIEISPASISILRLDKITAQLWQLNCLP